MTPQSWAASLLRALGIHQTPGAIQALVGWARAEGGHWNNSAKYNPLNTTQAMPGYQTFRSVGQGAADIGIYKSWQQGLDATVKTLRNGRYGGILHALATGDPNAVANAVGQTPWGTSAAGVRAAIAATPRVAGVHAGATTPTATGGAQRPNQYGAKTTTKTVGGVDNRAARGAAIAQFLQDNKPNPLEFAAQIKQLRDIPGRTVTTTTPGSAPSPSAGASSPTSSSFGKSHSPLLELFWQGAGGIDVKNGVKEPQGFVSGHTDHVHVAAGPKTVVDIGKIAQQMGLSVGENPHFGTVHPVHVAGSYHYKNQAIDVSGDPGKMRHFAAYVAHLYGVKVNGSR